MIRFGIIGCGSISKTHVDAIHSLKDAQLIACCDINEQRAKNLAELNNCLYLTDYKKLIQIPSIDIVVIGTPHYLHFEMTMMALKQGKHVICEKPMAMTVNEAGIISEAVKQSKNKYIVCFQNRFNETFIAAKRIIEQGGLGKLKGVECELTWSRDPDYYLSSDWKGRWETEGGGVLINQAIHIIDAALWMSESPIKVKGKIYNSCLENYIEVEDSAMATVVLKNNVPMVVMASNVFSSNPDPEITLDFEEGQLKVTAQKLYKNGILVDHASLKITDLEHSYWGNGHLALFRTFCDNIHSNEGNKLMNYLPNESSLDALKLIKGIYESSLNNEWVTL